MTGRQPKWKFSSVSIVQLPNEKLKVSFGSILFLVPFFFSSLASRDQNSLLCFFRAAAGFREQRNVKCPYIIYDVYVCLCAIFLSSMHEIFLSLFLGCSNEFPRRLAFRKKEEKNVWLFVVHARTFMLSFARHADRYIWMDGIDERPAEENETERKKESSNYSYSVYAMAPCLHCIYGPETWMKLEKKDKQQYFGGESFPRHTTVCVCVCAVK